MTMTIKAPVVGRIIRQKDEKCFPINQLSCGIGLRFNPDLDGIAIIPEKIIPCDYGSFAETAEGCSGVRIITKMKPGFHLCALRFKPQFSWKKL